MKKVRHLRAERKRVDALFAADTITLREHDRLTRAIGRAEMRAESYSERNASHKRRNTALRRLFIASLAQEASL